MNLKNLIIRVIAIYSVIIFTACHSQSLITPTYKVGDIYKIKMQHNTIGGTISNGGLKSSSNSRYTYTEKIIAVEPNGILIEFDLPASTTPKNRNRQWKFPARIFKHKNGNYQLKNIIEIEKRIDQWLLIAKRDRSNCGELGFTWTAFTIDCDPELILEIYALFDLDKITLKDGGEIFQIGSLGQSMLVAQNLKNGSFKFVTTIGIDPNYFKKQKAETDIAIAKLMQKPALSMEKAMNKNASIEYKGTVTTTIISDEYARKFEKVTVTKYQILPTTDEPEEHIITSTITRTKL